jgi:hypothetical protein
MNLDSADVSPGISAKPDAWAPGDALPSSGHQGNGSVESLSSQHKGSEMSVHYTFRIFRDWRGMYRWMLIDQGGKRLLASRFGFAALAGAFRDVEVERAKGEYASAGVRDETGR